MVRRDRALQRGRAAGRRAPMVLIDCREWTRIVPPSDPAGDPPGFWIEAIRARPEMPGFFLKPSREQK